MPQSNTLCNRESKCSKDLMHYLWQTNIGRKHGCSVRNYKSIQEVAHTGDPYYNSVRTYTFSSTRRVWGKFHEWVPTKHRSQPNTCFERTNKEDIIVLSEAHWSIYNPRYLKLLTTLMLCPPIITVVDGRYLQESIPHTISSVLAAFTFNYDSVQNSSTYLKRVLSIGKSSAIRTKSSANSNNQSYIVKNCTSDLLAPLSIDYTLSCI